MLPPAWHAPRSGLASARRQASPRPRVPHLFRPCFQPRWHASLAGPDRSCRTASANRNPSRFPSLRGKPGEPPPDPRGTVAADWPWRHHPRNAHTRGAHPPSRPLPPPGPTGSPSGTDKCCCAGKCIFRRSPRDCGRDTVRAGCCGPGGWNRSTPAGATPRRSSSPGAHREDLPAAAPRNGCKRWRAFPSSTPQVRPGLLLRPGLRPWRTSLWFSA